MSHPIQISNLRHQTSPDNLGAVRISVEVSYGGPFSKRELAWHDIPLELTSIANDWGDPWLLSFLPLAITLGRSLRLVGLPVDPQLVDNARKLMATWCRWYPEFSPVAIEADLRPLPTLPGERKTAAFFSGGVDSFYTLLHATESGSAQISDLLFVQGFDIPIHNQAACARVRRHLDRVATSFNVQLVPIATNLRQTRFGEASWNELAFGCLLAGGGLQFSQRYSRILIPSGLPLEHLRPHGSHPHTDPLFSNSHTAFRQYGEALMRHDKIEYLLSHQIALDNLRVCYESVSGENCGRCLKCVLVMTLLETYGALEDSAAFPGGSLNLDLLRKTYLSQGVISFRNAQAFARSRGREDISEAIENAFVRTERLDRWLGLSCIRTARQELGRHHALRRLTRHLRPWLWALGRRLNRLVP